MAVQLEFIRFIVQRKRIEEIYPGGWEGCLSDHARSIGRTVWYDDHLFSTGTMDVDMVDGMIKKWTKLGSNKPAAYGGVWQRYSSILSRWFQAMKKYVTRPKESGITPKGFEATEIVDGQTLWRDCCVVTSYGVSLHDCPWIMVDGSERIAWLRGTEPGEVIGRDHFR